jgi:hypothetical protein
MLALKACNGCFRARAADCFHVRRASPDGLSSICRDCQRIYDAARDGNPERISMRAAYAQSETGKAASARAKRAWASRNPMKRGAQVALNNAIRAGIVSRKQCEVCGREDAEGHHDDYNKPLEVIWLCPPHHAARHRELRRAA